MLGGCRVGGIEADLDEGFVAQGGASQEVHIMGFGGADIGCGAASSFQLKQYGGLQGKAVIAAAWSALGCILLHAK
ncbi:hypothetical protein [Desulfonatronum parangueonense]